MFYEKFQSIFDKNLEHNILKQFNASSNVSDVDLSQDLVIVSRYKQCPNVNDSTL